MASKVEDEAILTSKTDLLMSRSFDPFLLFFSFPPAERLSGILRILMT